MNPDPTPIRADLAGWLDVAAVAAPTVAAAAVAAALDLHERFSFSTRRLEWLQVDELPIVLLVFAASLISVAVRRYRQARRELTARRAAEARLSAALAANRQLAQEHLRVQEAERQRLARELHDELGQYLNAIKVDAVALRAPDLTNERSAAAGRQIVQSVDHVHAAVGDMIRRLRPVGLDDLGLAAALEACVDGWRDRLPDVRFDLALHGDLDSLGEAHNLAVYRLVQEGLTNAIRHSGADHVAVSVRRVEGPGAPAHIVLRIADAGRGASPQVLQRGFGLRGMQERAELLGGSLSVDTAPGAGFAVSASLPLLQESA
jgi:two-component system, NarL family, sensor histidine kinase UhpB